MLTLPENMEEALLELQTRRVPIPNAGERELTFTLIVWLGFDYLLDRGYFTVEQIVEFANVDGWEPPNAPFEMRFSSIVAYWTRRLNREYGDYDDYCKERL